MHIADVAAALGVGAGPRNQYLLPVSLVEVSQGFGHEVAAADRALAINGDDLLPRMAHVPAAGMAERLKGKSGSTVANRPANPGE